MTVVLLACLGILVIAGILFWRASAALRKAQIAYADARELNQIAGQRLADAQRIRENAKDILARAQELDPTSGVGWPE